MGKAIVTPLVLLAVCIITCSGLPTGTEDEPKKAEVKKPSGVPKITYSKEIRVDAGEAATLECEVRNVDLSNVAEFRILWSKLSEKKDTAPLAISSNTEILLLSNKYEIVHPENVSSYYYALKIRKTVEEDSATYRCTVVFSAEQKVDADVPLIVLKAAYFSDTSIKTVQVTEGDAITIDCQPGGSPKPDVFWNRVGQELPYYGGHYFQSNRFDLPLIDRSHKGHYRCQADNGLSDPAISEIVIEVTYKPSVNLSEEFIPAPAFDEVVLKCTTDGHPVPSVLWEKNGHEIQSSSNIVITTVTDEETNTANSTLLILKLQVDDFGEYTCIAQNELGIAKKTAVIALKTPPKIEKQTLGEKIYQISDFGRGRSKLPVALDCEASGVPAPRYRWFKDGSFLPWEADSRMSLEPGTGTLLIQSPRYTDNGIYTCTAFNELGTARSDDIKLVNETELNFHREEPADVEYEAELGKPFHFSCPKVTGHPQPEVMWMLARNKDEGIEMSPIEDKRMVVGKNGTLWITHITAQDDTFKNDFKFTCLATSELHPYDISLAKTVSIRVVDPPEGPYNLEDESVNIQPFLMDSSPDKVTFMSNSVNQLECIFGGEPVPLVMWERQEGEILRERFESKNNGQMLVFKDTQPEDAGNYTCRASNSVGVFGAKTIEVQVEVVPKFKNKFETQDQLVDEGTTVTFACDILGGNVETPKYEWFFNSRPIEIVAGSRRKLKGSNLVISAATVADTGNYACKASNDRGYAYGQTTLNVIPPDSRTKSTVTADSQVLQDIQTKVETLTTEVQTLKGLVETLVPTNQVSQSMVDLLNKIAEKVLGEQSVREEEESPTTTYSPDVFE